MLGVCEPTTAVNLGDGWIGVSKTFDVYSLVTNPGGTGARPRPKQMAGLITAEEIAAKREAREQQLKEADFLVQKWADKLQTNSSGGFVHHEGLTDVDPWGQQLRIDYKQDWFNEVATVRSAGPDTWFSHRREAKGKPRRSQHPIGFVLGTMFLAPFALMLFGIQFIGGVFGADGGFFDGDFEFGGGPDIDIDIDF